MIFDQSEKYENAYRASLALQFDEGEKKGKMKVAQAMRAKGYSIQEISALTGLSTKEIDLL